MGEVEVVVETGEVVAEYKPGSKEDETLTHSLKHQIIVDHIQAVKTSFCNLRYTVTISIYNC